MKNVFGKILGSILIVSFVVFIIILKVFDILPTKYLLMLVGGLILIIIPIANRLFRKKKVKLYTFRKTICYLLSIILIAFFAITTIYLNKTIEFLNNLRMATEEVTNYYVVVLDDVKYSEMSDIDGETIGIAEDISEDIINSIKLDVTYQKYDDSSLLIGDFINKNINVIIISDVLLDISSENNKDFGDEISILHTFSVVSETPDIVKEVSIKNTPFTVYISGIDTFKDLGSTRSRSDVNMLATVNPNTNEILLTSIPRDYYVQLHGKTGYKDKLTHAGYYGVDMSVQTIEDLLSIDINYYVKVNFNTLIKLVDAVGGIEVYSDASFKRGNCDFVVGNNNLNGECALHFARERYTYKAGDRHRIKNQQDVLTAIFKKLASSDTLITQYISLLDAMDGTFQTNLSTDNIIKFIKYKLSDFNSFEIKSIQLNGSDASEYTYSCSTQKLYVMKPNMNTVNNATKLITGMIEGHSLKELQ